MNNGPDKVFISTSWADEIFNDLQFALKMRRDDELVIYTSSIDRFNNYMLNE